MSIGDRTSALPQKPKSMIATETRAQDGATIVNVEVTTDEEINETSARDAVGSGFELFNNIRDNGDDNELIYHGCGAFVRIDKQSSAATSGLQVNKNVLDIGDQQLEASSLRKSTDHCVEIGDWRGHPHLAYGA